MGLPVEHGVRRASAPRVDSAFAAPGRRPAASGTPRRVVRDGGDVWLVAPGGPQGLGVPDLAGAATLPAEPVSVRVVGPGRRERSYLARLEELDEELGGARRELELAQLVERGSRRLLDRVEEDLERRRAETVELRQAQARLVLGLGALQTENEALRAENERLRSRVALLDAPKRRSWLGRLLGR